MHALAESEKYQHTIFTISRNKFMSAYKAMRWLTTILKKSYAQQYISVHFNICWFVRKAVEVELFREFYSTVTSPGFIAFPAELRNEFDWPPHLIERDNQTPSRVVAPICSYKAEHVNVGVCCAFRFR